MIWSYLTGGIPHPAAPAHLDLAPGRWVLPLLAALVTAALIIASGLSGGEQPRPAGQSLSSAEVKRALADDGATRSLGAPSGSSPAR